MGVTEIVISADQGWHVLRYAGGRVERVPIVAWRITGSSAEPVTINPAVDILCPDGSVTSSFGQFRSQDMWLEEQHRAQDPRGWSDPPTVAAIAKAAGMTFDVADAAASDARVTLNGAALLKSRPEPESKAAGLRRRRAIRRSRGR
jgi:hypothetical protein